MELLLRGGDTWRWSTRGIEHIRVWLHEIGNTRRSPPWPSLPPMSRDHGNVGCNGDTGDNGEKDGYCDGEIRAGCGTGEER